MALAKPPATARPLGLTTPSYRASALLGLVLVVGLLAARSFLSMYALEPIHPGPGVTRVTGLSEFHPGLAGTVGDTRVYVLEGKQPGGTALVLGGTHADEPSGHLSAVVLVENAVVAQGTLFVIPQADLSAFTHSYPLEGYPQRFTISTPHGKRWFSFGSRTANPVHQWPDPEIYVHKPSGQRLSGDETRNLNRAYPGRPDGTFVEQVAYGIRRLVERQHVDVTVDLHEAPPEYPFINSLSVHQRAADLGVLVTMALSAQGIRMGLESSPPKLHGLTPRELGDHTGTLAMIMETANPIQGRLRGKTDAKLIVEGKDACYVKAAKLGRTFVPFDESGQRIELRVGRHLSGVLEILNAFNMLQPDRTIRVTGVPVYREVVAWGLGRYLR